VIVMTTKTIERHRTKCGQVIHNRQQKLRLSLSASNFFLVLSTGQKMLVDNLKLESFRYFARKLRIVEKISS